MRKFTIILANIFFISYSLAGGEKCPTWPTYYEEEFCNCGNQLKNLTASLPKKMSVMSACLHDPDSSPRKIIDLRKKKISLDENAPYGTINIAGELTISGAIEFNSGDAGEFVSFKPDNDWEYWHLAHESSLWSVALPFKFLEEKDYSSLKIDANIKPFNTGCATARAKIQIGGLRVSIGETDESGGYPVNIKVIELEKYKACDKHAQ